MNSRPLTYEGADPRDEPVLTPNHFLVGQLGGQLAPQVADDIAFNPRHRWRLIQNLVRLFWKRWREEYLSTLNTRKKWREAKENLKVGDVVLVVDQNAPRGQWHLGRVEEMFPGQDGQNMVLNLSKREFRDAVKLRHDWPFYDIPSVCACGENFTVDHAMICKRGGFVIQRHNELRDLDADLLSIVCIEVEPVLQEITEEQLSRGSNRTQDARLDVRARGLWDPQNPAFFDVRVCHPNAESYKDQEPQQIYRIHENDKKRLYSS
ncbi:hypothetical protein AWC38_SpisGene13323 [Stylophora pistillata]|uniref:DUF5641 domain-containing protein n=1 Tax=Stylophora pistillata TaxID=50429 RepID=A0A2B4S0P9_STYPI|nr:hypothetical protein AWC38_SpisGene13323 [Stylophora pistillata]